MKYKFFFGIGLFLSLQANAQFLMDNIDSSAFTSEGMLNVYKKFNGLQLTGYVQPQFQVAQEKGINSFEGGDFSESVGNRFMLRRSRVRIDYVHFGQENASDVQIVFQFDANERGFTVRDVWGRISENRLKMFSFTTGIFARPMGFEVNYSSSNRETPERGRMSQTLMKSERDLGAMISFNPRKKEYAFKWLRVDLGLFNGQGIVASGEFDHEKDIIGRVSVLPITIQDKFTLSGSGSFLKGGLSNASKFHYQTKSENGLPTVYVDSALQNIGSRSDRNYVGADLQLKIKNKVGFTTLRAETIFGTQTGTEFSSVTPTKLLPDNEGFYLRKFNGAYFYLIQDLFSEKHQLVLKYDWYDPNTQAAGAEINAAQNFTVADIRYQTLGLGYIYYMNDHVKLQLYHAWVKNEETALPGFENDLKDNVFTGRLQFRF